MEFNYDDYKEQEMEYKAKNENLYVYYNPHPSKKETNDCVKRALTKATKLDYKVIQQELNKHKVITKSKTFNERKNWVSYVENVLGYKKIIGYTNTKIGEFAKVHTKGTYIIKCRKHLVTVENGKIYDTWNSSFKAINRVYKAQ
jgi:ribosomal protein L35AE/L33A